MSLAVHAGGTGDAELAKENATHDGHVGNAFSTSISSTNLIGDVNSPLDWSEAEWNDNMRTNLTGLWLVSKHVCRLMRDAKQGGSVINISSIGGIERGHLPGGIAYDA